MEDLQLPRASFNAQKVALCCWSILLWIVLWYRGLSLYFYFRVRCAAGTASTGSILSVGTAHTASTRSAKMLSISAIYSEYEAYFDQFLHIFFQDKTFTDGAKSGSLSK